MNLDGPPESTVFCKPRDLGPISSVAYNRLFHLLKQQEWPQTWRQSVRGHGACLGLVKLPSGPSLSAATAPNQELLAEINRILQEEVLPFFPLVWTSVQINKDTVSGWHVDESNKGPSLITSLGDYTGGEFMIEAGEYPILRRLVVFDGRAQHASNDFIGSRYSVIAFPHKAIDDCDAELKGHLRGLGFHLPGELPRAIKLRQRFFLELCSGPHAPLSRACLALGGATLRPLDSHMSVGGPLHDITSPETYDFVSRLIWTGVVAYAHGGPPCSAYSKLRELPGGPPAVRSLKYLDGFPNPTPQAAAEVQKIRLIHMVIIEWLTLVVTLGGHASYEQPPSSLA